MKSISGRPGVRTALACGVLAATVLATPAAADPAELAQSTDTGPLAVPPVSVTGTPLTSDQQLQSEGAAIDGYRVETAPDVGPWGAAPILDTPYSVSVAPKELLENTQTTLSDQFFLHDPFTQLFQTTDWGSPNLVATRGFFNNAQFIDGLQTFDVVNSAEDKQSAEVITGLSGFFYGPASIGGVLDFALKRPTPDPLADVTAGALGDSGYVHGDFGGPIGSSDRVAFRLNVAGQSGDGTVDQTTIERGLLSGALDVHITDNLLFQVDAAQNWYHTTGTGADFIFLGPGVPAAPDTSLQWGQRWAFYDIDDFRGAPKLTWTINDALTFRTAFSGSTETTSQLWTDAFVAPDKTITQAVAGLLNDSYVNKSFYAELDGTLATGPVQHHLVAKTSLFSFDSYGPSDDFVFQSLPGACSLAAPCAQLPSMLVAGGLQPVRKDSEQDHLDNILGDEIRLSDQWSLLAGFDWTQIVTQSFDPVAGAETSGYHRGNVGPSASLLFKPIPTVSTYFTFMQGLESGSVAATSFNGLPVTNANQADAPTLDDQYELGAKARLGGTLLTLALFYITRATDEYVENGTASYTLLPSGEEEHRGVEIGISGKVTAEITLWGGATWFDATITAQPEAPNLVGKAPTGVAQAMAKLYGEYAVPQVNGLVLDAGVYYTGSQWLDAANTQKLPGFVTADIGTRYDATLYGRETVFRLNVTNLSGENYWLQGGELGVPRTFMLTLESRF